MFSETLYTIYTVVHGLLLGFGLLLSLRTRRVSSWLATAVAFGLVYDNLMLSIGNELGAGALLLGLSRWRFVLHQVVLPGIMVTAFYQVRRAGIPWAQSKRALQVVWVGTILVALAGIATRVVGLQLEAAVMDGVLRYVATNVSGPPIVSIVSIGFAGVMGIFLWRRAGWPWLTITALLVFIGEGIPSEAIRRVLGSGAEVLFMLVVFLREREPDR